MDRRAPPWVGAPEARAKFAVAARLWDMPATAMSHPGVGGAHRAPRLAERRPMGVALPWVGARITRSYAPAGYARRGRARLAHRRAKLAYWPQSELRSVGAPRRRRGGLCRVAS